MKVMAHRGYSGAYPENTMLSFREAVKVGCAAIEMDVHETRDGRLVVIHDERLERTTDGTGRICEHTFDELRQVNADVLVLAVGVGRTDEHRVHEAGGGNFLAPDNDIVKQFSRDHVDDDKHDRHDHHRARDIRVEIFQYFFQICFPLLSVALRSNAGCPAACAGHPA